MFLHTQIECVRKYMFAIAVEISLRMIFPDDLGPYLLSKYIYSHKKRH